MSELENIVAKIEIKGEAAATEILDKHLNHLILIQLTKREEIQKGGYAFPHLLLYSRLVQIN